MKRFKLLATTAFAVAMALAATNASADGTCVLTCPANVTLATAPGGSAVAFSYMVSSTGNCGGIVQISGLPSGSSFPVGTVTNGWQAVDPPQQTCFFNVEVIATPGSANPVSVPAVGPLALALAAAAVAVGGVMARRRRNGTGN